MIIKEVVDVAKYGELAGTAVKDSTDAIVAFINMGMLELYTRFPLRTEEHLIELQESQVYYDMPADFMYPMCAYGEAPESSQDSAMPIPINNEDNPYSIFFIDWKTVQVPSTVDDAYISIIYGAKPTPITVAQVEDGTSELDLPDPLIDALLSYLGYRAHLSIHGDAQSENNAHWVRFERNCEKAIQLGVGTPSDSLSMATRIEYRGFV